MTTKAITSRAFVRSQVREVDIAIARVQEAARDSLQRVIDAGTASGRNVKDVAIGTTATQIAHGLGRTPRGWWITDASVGATVYKTAADSRTITLIASSAGTFSVWVF